MFSGIFYLFCFLALFLPPTYWFWIVSQVVYLHHTWSELFASTFPPTYLISTVFPALFVQNIYHNLFQSCCPQTNLISTDLKLSSSNIFILNCISALFLQHIWPMLFVMNYFQALFLPFISFEVSPAVFLQHVSSELFLNCFTLTYLFWTVSQLNWTLTSQPSRSLQDVLMSSLHL